MRCSPNDEIKKELPHQYSKISSNLFVQYAARMSGTSQQIGTGQDYQRGIQPVAVQVPGTGHLKALGKSSLTDGQ